MGILDDGRWHGRVFAGEWITPEGGERTVREVATGAELGRIGLAGPGDVSRAGATAAAAQREWAARPYFERAAVLRRAAQLWSEHAAEVRDWIVRESGSVAPKADFELNYATQECYEAAALTSRATGEVIPSDQPRLSMVRRVPVGVVGVISPFNAPLILSIRSVAPALALGNAVVLKPDPRTAVCGGAALAAVFEQAGLPAGLLHVLPGDAATGQALIADPNVRVVSFTGSSAAGRAVGELAGRHLKRVHLELGGNSALIVLEDADVDAAASAGAWGTFFHQGQVCMASGRHLVHESLYDDYVQRLAARADRLPVGNPATEDVVLGPIIDERQRDKVHELVTTSVEAGARLAAGGTFEGLFYRPTVLAGARPSVPAYDNEVFGPVAPVSSFASLEEAAKLAADSEYGLSLGILTTDVMHGLELAERIPTGIVHINDQTVSDEALAPFGGILASGTGSRFGGASANVDAFTETRWVTVRPAIARYPM
jgi:benzaldehyde dehydrogenase (NAD)